MRQPLKKTVRDRFADVELGSRQMDDLEGILQSASAPRRPWWRHPATAAAVVLLAVGSLVSIQQYESYRAAGLLEAIAIEVADNHLKLKPLEIESADLRSVLGYFEDLDFQLQASPRITGNPGDRLLGGRYCTCLLYTSPSPRDATLSRMPSSA